MSSDLYVDRVLKWKAQGIRDDYDNPGWQPIQKGTDRICPVCKQPTDHTAAAINLGGGLELQVHKRCLDALEAELVPQVSLPVGRETSTPTRQTTHREWIPESTSASKPMGKALTTYLEKGYSPYLLCEALEKAGNRNTLIAKSSPVPFKVNQPTESERLIKWLAEHDPDALVDIANIVHEYDPE